MHAYFARAQCALVKNKDPKAKEKFQEISIAYTRMISARNEQDEDMDHDDIGEDNPQGPYYDDDEMRAFMRMFMDLVSMFSDRQVPMVDSNASGVYQMRYDRSMDKDALSTEDEEGFEGDEGDGLDDDDEDYYSDDGHGDTTWEPQAKHYCHMNLKAEVATAREARGQESSPSIEEKRKQKNAKKRRKQKEKRQREAQRKAEEEELKRAQARSCIMCM
jgi:hypothetical protein